MVVSHQNKVLLIVALLGCLPGTAWMPNLLNSSARRGWPEAGVSINRLYLRKGKKVFQKNFTLFIQEQTYSLNLWHYWY